MEQNAWIDKCRARRRRARRVSEERRRCAWRQVAGCVMLIAVMQGIVLCCVPHALADTGCASAFGLASGNARAGQQTKVASSAGGLCRAALSWPVSELVSVTSPFDEPAQPWLSGHRGIDMRASPGEQLLAPSDGIISFAGLVAGKQVVSIRCRKLTLTFEPAVTDLGVGAQVKRGESFATVGDKSDHCDGSCVHWGVRRDKKSYLDPQHLVSPQHIALKPVT